MSIEYTTIKKNLREIQKRYSSDHVSALATKLTFYTLLSIFPFIIVFLEIFRISNFTDTSLFTDFTSLFPYTVINFVTYLYNDAVNNTSGTILPFASIIALWSASRAINAIIQSLRIAYRVQVKRNFIYMRLLAFGYTLAFIIVVILTGALILFGNRIYHTIMSYVDIPFDLERTIDILRYVTTIFISIVFFSGIYNVVPTKGHRFFSTLPGTLVATLGWIGTSAFFSIYANLSASLSYIYGSLADIVIVMLWLYVCSIIIVMGGEINAVIGNYNTMDEKDANSTPIDEN